MRLQQPSGSSSRSLLSTIAYGQKLLGDANDKLGKYQVSFAAYSQMNLLERDPTIVPMVETRMGSAKDFWRDLTNSVPPLPRVKRDDIVMQLGFPRSGTTLLENVLEAHPMVETLEEMPTWDAAFAVARPQWRSWQPREVAAVSQFTHVRDLYFTEVDKRRKKSGAEMVIDKYPLRTLSAGVLKRILPEQKYIFCIRHPFDVVLSCFRQRFSANIGMESFRTIAGAIELYDLAMSLWFDEHDMADPFVRYVRYDEVVNSFDNTIRGVLDFMGLEWDPRVRDFARGSQDRLAYTPSYQKVRQGISIGVQTYWRNYGFLFQTPEAKPLHKWAAFFGYETK
jgi:hypothetical protein